MSVAVTGTLALNLYKYDFFSPRVAIAALGFTPWGC